MKLNQRLLELSRVESEGFDCLPFVGESFGGFSEGAHAIPLKI